MEIKVGTMVTISADATYYYGEEVTAEVRNDKWAVKMIDGDKAILGYNESGSRDLNSPVNMKYLTAAAATQASGTQAPASSVAGEMSVSDRGVELIAKYEGCRLEAYKCPAGVWTIGYGHTAGVQEGQTLPSKEAAKELLKEDLKKYGGYVNNCVKKGLIRFPLNQNQFDALTSFCYNCGNGSLQKLVTDRDAATVAEKLLAYNKAGGKELAGLTRRRTEERELFLT